jgi:coenzyme F420-0:L-glutamate ligase / coenzyme F420-1:gamma-L-glutamate ligase
VYQKIEIIPIRIDKNIAQGDKLSKIVLESIRDVGETLNDQDIVVVAQKVVSKAEGQTINLDSIVPSELSLKLAKRNSKDPRVMELILRESKALIKLSDGVIIVETKHGFICANAGIDQSNIHEGGNSATALPKDPDLSARKLRGYFKRNAGKDVAVIITDTFGRPFREGQTNVAIGIAGLDPLKSYIGMRDMYGRELKVTEIAVVDEIASAAELVMGKSEGIPVAIVRGYRYLCTEISSVSKLLRSKEKDLFR